MPALLHRLFQFLLVIAEQGMDFTVRFLADSVDLRTEFLARRVRILIDQRLNLVVVLLQQRPDLLLLLRSFARLFRGEVGITPAAWVEAVRVTAARRLLEDGQNTPKQVAARCGFADAHTLRRSFARHVGVTPAEYRKRYAGGSKRECRRYRIR